MVTSSKTSRHDHWAVTTSWQKCRAPCHRAPRQAANNHSKINGPRQGRRKSGPPDEDNCGALTPALHGGIHRPSARRATTKPSNQRTQCETRPYTRSSIARERARHDAHDWEMPIANHRATQCSPARPQLTNRRLACKNVRSMNKSKSRLAMPRGTRMPSSLEWPFWGLWR